MSRVARLAKPNKILDHHCTALRLGDDVAAMVCLARAAGGAALKSRHDMRADVSGDAGLAGHDSVSSLADDSP